MATLTTTDVKPDQVDHAGLFSQLFLFGGPALAFIVAIIAVW